jgi:hypothetical protein
LTEIEVGGDYTESWIVESALAQRRSLEVSHRIVQTRASMITAEAQVVDGGVAATRVGGGVRVLADA